MISFKEFFTRYPSPVSFLKQKLTKKKDKIIQPFDDYAFSRKMAAMKPVETAKSFLKQYPTPTSFFQQTKATGQQLGQFRGEVKEPLHIKVAKWILPEKAEKFFGLDGQRKIAEQEKDRQSYLIEKGKLKDITLNRHTKNFIIGIGGTTEGMIGAAEWISPKSIKPFFKEKGDQTKLWQQKMIPEDRKFIDDLVTGAGSMVTFFIPGMGVAKAAQVVAKVSPKLALLFGNVAATALESATESGFIYRLKKELGVGEKEASWAATKTFIANSVLIGLTNKFGAFSSGTKSAFKRMVMSSPMEGLQEYWQEVIQNVNMGKPAFEGALRSGTIGALLGLPMGGISGLSFNNLETTEQHKIVEEKILSRVEEISKGIKPGLTIEEVGKAPKEFISAKELPFRMEKTMYGDRLLKKRYSFEFGNKQALINYDGGTKKYYPVGRNLKTGEQIPFWKFDKTLTDKRTGYKTLDEAKERIFKDFYKATKAVKEVKPKETFDKYLEMEFGKPDKIQEQFLKEAEVIKREVEGDLFKSIKELGGIKSFRKGELAEEMKPIPLSLRNNKTGSTLDELADELLAKGYSFSDGEQLRNAILEIKTEARPIKEAKDIVRTLKTIKKIAPKKAKVSQRLINKLHKLKFPKITAETKSIRRALETGKFKPTREWLARPSKLYREGKLPAVVSKYLSGKISKVLKEERKYQPTISPEAVPKKALSGFDNFIDLTKIKRKDIPYKKMDIAEIVRADKMFPAIRMSGFYATKEIQTAEIRNEYKQLLSPHLMALQQDGYKLGSKFGVIFKKVWIPTQKAIRNEIEFTKQNHNEGVKIFKKHNYKLTDKSLKRFSDLMEFGKGTPKEMELVQEMRQYLDNLRDQDNAVREITKRDKMGYIKDYVPHIQKAVLWNELLSNVATISDSLDFIIPNQVKNPFAYKRLGEEMPNAERNFGILLDRYVRAVAKDIYITPAIENIKAYNGVLKNRDLINASKYWDEYIRFGLVGKQHKIDTALSIGQTGGRISQKWNDMVNKAFLTGKIAWNIGTQPLSYIMYTGMEAGEINAVKAVYKSFKKPLRQYVKENSDVLAIKSNDVLAVATGEGRNIQNRIYRTKIDKYNDFISMLSAIEERELTLASYIAGLDRAKDLGYKGQEALWFADLTAARTQSMYNRQNRALILDSDIARTLFPFQSFSVESFNHLREIFTKESGAVALNARQRTGKLFRLLIGIYLSSLYYKFLTGKKKTTLGTFFPFIGNYMDMLIAQAKGETYYGGRSPITPVQIGSDVIKGSRDFIKYGDLKKLRKVGVNFGLALFGIGGGGQLNNIIDGLMADIEGEVRNVKGKTMFKVEDTLSKIKAPIFGVWATKEGIEYWLPKGEKETKPTGATAPAGMKGMPSMKDMMGGGMKGGMPSMKDMMK